MEGQIINILLSQGLLYVKFLSLKSLGLGYPERFCSWCIDDAVLNFVNKLGKLTGVYWEIWDLKYAPPTPLIVKSIYSKLATSHAPY